MQVQMRMQTLKEKLFLHVAAVLEATEDSPASSLVRTGRWKAAWDKATRFLARSSSAEAAHAAELQATLSELHHDIQSQIGAEVGACMPGFVVGWGRGSCSVIACQAIGRQTVRACA